jgi:DUF1680 family protein
MPDPRIDALRGTIALERGPLVYAVEDADLPAGASVESLEVDPALEVRALAEGVPGGDPGGTRLEFEAVIRADADREWPYRSQAAGVQSDEAPARTTARVSAVPYFAWAQREGLGMRVWLPTRSPTRADAERPPGIGASRATGGA